MSTEKVILNLDTYNDMVASLHHAKNAAMMKNNEVLKLQDAVFYLKKEYIAIFINKYHRYFNNYFHDDDFATKKQGYYYKELLSQIDDNLRKIITMDELVDAWIKENIAEPNTGIEPSESED